jgi:hypothetical protein
VMELPDLDGVVLRFDQAVARLLDAVHRGDRSDVDVDRAASAVDVAQDLLQTVAFGWYVRVRAEQGEDRANALLAGFDVPSCEPLLDAGAGRRDAVLRGDRSEAGRAGSEMSESWRSWRSAATYSRVRAIHGGDSANAVLGAIERAAATRRLRLAVASFVFIGPKPDFDRLVDEYGWSPADLEGNLVVESPDWSRIDGSAPSSDYYVRRSLLRAHPPFDGAGDAEAARFCQEIADHMIEKFGISGDEAVARINQHWPGNHRVPIVWIVGLSIAYHKQPASWAGDMYYGPESRWWDPDANPAPLPPPPA